MFVQVYLHITVWTFKRKGFVFRLFFKLGILESQICLQWWLLRRGAAKASVIRNGPRGGMIQLAVASKSTVAIYDGVDMDERIDAQCSINKPLVSPPPTYTNSHISDAQPPLPDNPSRNQLHAYHQRNNYMPHNPSFPRTPFPTLTPAVYGLSPPTPTRSNPKLSCPTTVKGIPYDRPRSTRHARNSHICHRISANRRANRILQRSIVEATAIEAERSHDVLSKIGYRIQRSIDLAPMW